MEDDLIYTIRSHRQPSPCFVLLASSNGFFSSLLCYSWNVTVRSIDACSFKMNQHCMTRSGISGIVLPYDNGSYVLRGSRDQGQVQHWVSATIRHDKLPPTRTRCHRQAYSTISTYEVLPTYRVHATASKGTVSTSPTHVVTSEFTVTPALTPSHCSEKVVFMQSLY